MDASNQSSTKVTPNDKQLNADCQTLPTTTGNAVPAQPTTNSDPRLNLAKKNPNANNQTIDTIDLIPNTKRYNSITKMYSFLPSKKMKECREEFLGHQATATKVTVAPLPELPPMNLTSLRTIAKEGDVPGMLPFEKNDNNSCSTIGYNSTITRLKHPKSNDKYKSKQYICLECYEKRKAYQNKKHNNLHREQKSQSIAEAVLGWHQTEPIVFHHPVWLPPYINTAQVYVATFSILFATQVLNLRRLPQSNTFSTVKKNIGADITNNRGRSRGGYTISGRDALGSWKNEKQKMFGGKESSNSIIHTIEYILQAVKDKMPGYSITMYQEMVGYIVTYEDYIQTPHLDISSSSVYSYIIHVPLCINGAWIYVWERGDGITINREMIHIPFGSMLVLRSDVWHGGIVGGKGNLRFHAAIMARDDLMSTDQLVYDVTPKEAKKKFDSLKVYYSKAKTFFDNDTKRTLPYLAKYIQAYCKHLPPAYFKNLK